MLAVRLRAFALRLVGMLRREASDREFAEELESHLALHVDDNMRAGMTAEEARRQALIKLGGFAATAEMYRRQRGLPLLEELWRDLRYAVRVLVRRPGFLLAVTVTLALGVGANTAIFSIVNGVLLRPLPYLNAERIVVLWETDALGVQAHVSQPNFEDWRGQQQSFESISAHMGRWGGPSTVTGGTEPGRAHAVGVFHDSSTFWASRRFWAVPSYRRSPCGCTWRGRGEPRVLAAATKQQARRSTTPKSSTHSYIRSASTPTTRGWMRSCKRIAASPGSFGIFGRLPPPVPPTNTRGGESLRDMYERGQRYLRDLARVTGGRYFDVNPDLRDLDRNFEQIAEELRRHYSLGYYPRPRGRPGERRRFRVRVDRPGVAVTSRGSYIL